MEKQQHYRPRSSRKVLFQSLLVAASLAVVTITTFSYSLGHHREESTVPINAKEIIHKCQALDVLPGPPADFHLRKTSDRFEPGTPPTLIINATIWTGGGSGTEILHGDIVLDGGVIVEAGSIKDKFLTKYHNLNIIDAEGAWVTPGIVDMHSHLGVDSAPALRGSDDTNSLKGLVLPWLRSLDGLNTHDDAYRLSISGGVTTANVLPGSADAIGGQAFTIKLRPTKEKSSSSMVLEPPHTLNGTDGHDILPPRWRQMKHACGENPSRVYSGTRMDTIWAFRQGYDSARVIKNKQDSYCAKALKGEWNGLGDFPEDLQWEALVDVLRGRVKVHNHCYEATDLDGMVRLTNEFKFSIAAFHHAHETYLVPNLLKKAYGKTPAVALFATNARYKREAYRGSEFAPAILADNGLRVVMKSDHPVLNSRHLLFEAQQAHYYGLPYNLALSSVISTPAEVLGYDHRVGFIKPGKALRLFGLRWDTNAYISHPLSLGAAPRQVFIDGIPQFEKPYVSKKSNQLQRRPSTPNFSKEKQDAIKYDGLPPLETTKTGDIVLFTNVSKVFTRNGYDIQEMTSKSQGAVDVLIQGAEIICIGAGVSCGTGNYSSAHKVDLQGGSISPSLLSFGSHLALNHIDAESSTNDGVVNNILLTESPSIAGEGALIRAVDGLQFSTRDALIAHKSGVTIGVSAPSSKGFLAGLGVAFRTGAPHRLARGAIVQEVTSLHIEIDSSKASISTQIGALRSLLSGGAKGSQMVFFEQVADGKLPLVIQVQSADIMATLISIKREVEIERGNTIQMTFAGANEAHLLAKEIGEAGIGVILRPSRPFPGTWKSRRILPGPPLTPKNAISVLQEHNVVVGIGVEEQWSSRNLRFDASWVALESNGRITDREAIALASVNLERLLGLHPGAPDLVATVGGTILEFESKVAAIISPLQGRVELMV
ncbi:hypothetical protein CVT24_005143 [Panaeolus cyanescens]|uniref:Amidohydrolase-related domain-containing protein n=1 Tax=Panaeolus cyanescens TaxID=181874 RepID=A0A409V9Q7_9AGAR|nr:hypothetical protein CVT24_005143 [Panaeolus cyanescens]